MQAAKEEKIPVFAHCEDKSLMKSGVINAGARAKELHLDGILNAVEDTSQFPAFLPFRHCSNGEHIDGCQIFRFLMDIINYI